MLNITDPSINDRARATLVAASVPGSESTADKEGRMRPINRLFSERDPEYPEGETE